MRTNCFVIVMVYRLWSTREESNKRKQSKLGLVYFDQGLDAAHYKHQSKYAFSMFFCAKKLKKVRKSL